MKMTFKTTGPNIIFDIAKMIEHVSAEEKYFDSFGKLEKTKDGRIVFIDRGASILAVAHTDTVRETKFNGLFSSTPGRVSDKSFTVLPKLDSKIHKGKTSDNHPFMSMKKHLTIFAAAGLDDRLGVYIITEILPQLNIEVDVLLTTNEERGDSTAKKFHELYPDKKYNWIIEFDRRGDDVVMYQYDKPELRDKLKEIGAKPSTGSYTDICDLWELGCAGFNWGTGYHYAHSLDSFAILQVTAEQIAIFAKFYDKYKNTYFKAEKLAPYRSRIVHTTAHTATNAINTPYKIRYKCNCGEEIVNITKGKTWICKCGIEYWRGETTGDVFTVERSGTNIVNRTWVKKITYADQYWPPMKQQQLNVCCELCSGWVGRDKTSDTEYGVMCMKCTASLFTHCMFCGELFFNGGHDEFNVCSTCMFF